MISLTWLDIWVGKQGSGELSNSVFALQVARFWGLCKLARVPQNITESIQFSLSNPQNLAICRAKHYMKFIPPKCERKKVLWSCKTNI